MSSIYDTSLDTAVLELTSVCNLRCVHCYAAAGYQQGNELTSNEILRLADELAEEGIKRVILTGGEPLLHKDFLKISRYMSKKGFDIIIETNGTLVNERILKELKKLRVKEIRISLNGATGRTNDKITGVQGSFEKTVQAIKLCVKRGFNVKVVPTIMNQNKNEIIGIRNLCRTLGVKMAVLLVISTGRGTNPALDVSLGEYSKIMEELGIRNQRIAPCGVGYNKIAILSSGDLTPCELMQNMVAGNIRKDKIKDVFLNSAVFKEVRKATVDNIPKCKKCKAKESCWGGCRARVLAATGSLFLPDQVQCACFGVEKTLH